MKVLKRLFDFYIDGSIHVALSCFALVRMTQHLFEITHDESMAYFAFFGTIVGYNFVKYDALARTKKVKKSKQIITIATLSFLSFVAATICFYQLERITQVVSIAFLVLTLLYTLPFFPNKRNARNWAGIKIYIVAFCWVGVTLVLPIINAEIPITSDFYLKAIQRFVLLFSLILIFEIIDLKKDDPHLKTVPQQIGVKRTKLLGYGLMVLFCALEWFNVAANDSMSILKIEVPLQFFAAITVILFLFFAKENRSKYYTSFWVESIPIFWWWLFLFFDKL
jgi:hypothetical protein